MLDAEHGPSRPANDTALAETDLGLLLALEALLHERNVTRAASRLNIGQPALSARLNRLRQVFADPLFVPAAASFGDINTTDKAKDAAEFVANTKLTKETPMASSGVDSIPHLAVEQLSDATAASFLHVPYRGRAGLV
jgi:hypothetical protein